MEDRQPTGLLLEMIDVGEASPEAAVRWEAEEIPRALETGMFTRATIFSNLRPEENRFPRKIEEFSHLIVYETQDPEPAHAFDRAMPALSPEAEGVHVRNRIGFRRYPRPSQGRLSGKPTNGIYLILISATERGRAQELRDWADFVHLHHIASAAPAGFTIITPYENAGGTDPLYMHLYELDTEDPVTAVDDMTPTVCKYWGFEMGDDAFMGWAICEPLDIWYVNVFGRTIGVKGI